MNARNLDQMFLRDVAEINVAEWCRERDGKGKPEQVHMLLKVTDFPGQLVVRFKAPGLLDRVIDALIKHRESVWGGRK